MYKKFSLFLLLIIIIISSVACNKIIEDTNFIELNREDLSTISPSVGGSITIPIINYDTINPLYPSNSSIFYFSKLIYDSLFEYNENGEIEPNLVEHYVLSPDKTTLTLTIKDNIYWHNGEKLTTEDILTTFNFLKSAEKKSPYYNIFKTCVGYEEEFNSQNFLTMEIFDERNIDLHFNKAYSENLQMLTFPIVPKSEIESLKDDPDTHLEIIGSGAYKLKEIREGSHIVLERNENFHGKLPYISNIIAKIFSNDELAQLAFETGLINIVKSSNYEWAKYQDNQNVRIEEYNSNEMDMIVFNHQRAKFTGDNGKIIKQAISRSINKKRIIDRLFLGKAIETSIPLNINTMNHYGLKSDTYYNEDIAKELLANIGYTNINGEGLLINENGETIDLYINANFANNQKRIIADFIIQDLRAIGINAYTDYRISAIEETSSEQLKLENEKFISDLTTGQFDIAIITVNLSNMSDIGNLLHSNAINNGLNYGNYSNAYFDLLLNKIKTNSDYNSTKENYLKIIEIYNEDMPIVPMYIKTNALLIESKLQGELNPIDSDIYRFFRNLFILKQFQ